MKSYLAGCFCVYSEVSSFEYIRSSLEKTLLSNLEQDDRLPFGGLPLVILFQPSSSLSEKDCLRLQEEGQNLADSLQSPFIEVPPHCQFSCGQIPLLHSVSIYISPRCHLHSAQYILNP